MMKRKYSRFVLAAALIAIVSSCAKDDTSLSTDKYIGSWSCKETPSTGGATTFSINISKHGNSDTLDVYNFDNLGSNAKAIFVVNDNSIVIPSQTITGFSISGYGTYTSGKINLNYSVDSDNYTAVCTQ